MPSTNVFNELCNKITLLKSIPKKILTEVTRMTTVCCNMNKISRWLEIRISPFKSESRSNREKVCGTLMSSE